MSLDYDAFGSSALNAFRDSGLNARNRDQRPAFVGVCLRLRIVYHDDLKKVRGELNADWENLRKFINRFDLDYFEDLPDQTTYVGDYDPGTGRATIPPHGSCPYGYGGDLPTVFRTGFHDPGGVGRSFAVVCRVVDQISGEGATEVVMQVGQHRLSAPSNFVTRLYPVGENFLNGNTRDAQHPIGTGPGYIDFQLIEDQRGRWPEFSGSNITLDPAVFHGVHNFPDLPFETTLRGPSGLSEEFVLLVARNRNVWTAVRRYRPVIYPALPYPFNAQEGTILRVPIAARSWVADRTLGCFTPGRGAELLPRDEDYPSDPPPLSVIRGRGQLIDCKVPNVGVPPGWPPPGIAGDVNAGSSTTDNRLVLGYTAITLLH